MLATVGERLTAEDWVAFGLKTLGNDGFAALKADVLARKLSISRGSFYWHFADLETFQGRVIAHWKQSATEAIITDIERYDSPAERLDALLRHAFRQGRSLETGMRGWAANNKIAARAVAEVDHRRCAYLQRLLQDAGLDAPLAATRAQLLYWTYLGASLSGSRLSGEQLDRAVAELKRLGLAETSKELTRV
jgi:AcrR family transcriptional regulator